METGTKPTVEAITELCEYLCDAKPKTSRHGEHIETLRAALANAIDSARALANYEHEAERIGWKNQEYIERVEACGFDHISPPPVVEEFEDEDGCTEERETGQYDWQDSYFSRQQCDACQTTLAGSRIDGLTLIDGKTVEVSVCSDCLMYLSNGDLPED